MPKYCFHKDMVSGRTVRVLNTVAAHPSVTNIILHTVKKDDVTPESEVLKREFTDLLNTVGSVNSEVFISLPLPAVRRGAEQQIVGTKHRAFNCCWDQRSLVKAGGLGLFVLPASPICFFCQEQETRRI